MPLAGDALLDHLTVDARSVASLVPGLALSLPVPSCPGWAMLDLVGHLGSVHRWATEVVRSRAVAEQSPAPVEATALAPWFAAGVQDLLETLRGTEPGQPCWGFGTPPRLVDFWVRRQALETSVHRWDILDALGQACAISVDLAQDGVDEAVCVLFPRQVRLGRMGRLDGAVLLRVAETGASWVLGTDGVEPPGEPVASVTAPASCLFLLLWRRVRLDAAEVTIEGDQAAVECAFSAALTP
jgi:uncharacterized protein (TIGR03083 family)